MSKQPSSMCPAFGAIRNLLRMEDAMPIVISSGDGCMYGHTFVAHFYVANRPIFSPGVSSQMWAKGSEMCIRDSPRDSLGFRTRSANVAVDRSRRRSF